MVLLGVGVTVPYRVDKKPSAAEMTSFKALKTKQVKEQTSVWRRAGDEGPKEKEEEARRGVKVWGEQKKCRGEKFNIFLI